MKQKFTTWVSYLLAVATTLMVAMSFASCGNDDLYNRDPNQNEIGDKVVLEVDNAGPFEVAAAGGEVSVNIKCNTTWTVAVGTTSSSILKILPENVTVNYFEGGSVKVTVNENKGSRARTGTFAVSTNTKSVSVSINQAAKE